MPFDATSTIPEGWSAHHQDVITGASNAKVTITDPTRTEPGEWDEETGTWGPPVPHVIAGGPDDPNPHWAGGVPCRIQRLRSDQVHQQAGQDITARHYLIQLPADVPQVEVGHLATVTAAINDAHLIGEQLAASDVQHGSERFTRDVAWVHNQQPPQVP